jgi:hypothetical protein
VIANAKFMLNDEEHLAELLRERRRMFKETVRRPHSHSIQQTGEEDHSPSVCYAGAGGLAHTRVSFALKASGSEAMCTPAGRCARLAPPRGVLSVAERGAKRTVQHTCVSAGC